jgi:hypothetical protein
MPGGWALFFSALSDSRSIPLSLFSKNPHLPYLIGLLILHHLQVVDHPGLVSARILLGRFSQNLPYPWCLLLFICLLLGYKFLFFLVGFGVQSSSIQLVLQMLEFCTCRFHQSWTEILHPQLCLYWAHTDFFPCHCSLNNTTIYMAFSSLGVSTPVMIKECGRICMYSICKYSIIL